MRENKETEAIAARSRPGVPRTHSDSSLLQATEAASVAAQRELERLPNQILQQARVFHSHMQYLANNADTNWEDTRNSESAAATANGGKNAASRTPAELRALLDEIANLDEIGERTKRDIMEDDETRNVSNTLPAASNNAHRECLHRPY